MMDLWHTSNNAWPLPLTSGEN